jgi:hypothetical protein
MKSRSRKSPRAKSLPPVSWTTETAGETLRRGLPTSLCTDGTQVVCVQQAFLNFPKVSPLVILNNRFGIGRHHLGGLHPGLDFVLQLSQFRLREVLHLSMEEFFRVTPLGEVKRAPFIGILKDEPLASLDGFIVRLSFHHASLLSYPPFQHQP